jgi:hypothetical protein
MDPHPHADRIIKTIRPEFIKDDLQGRQFTAAETLLRLDRGLICRFEQVLSYTSKAGDNYTRLDVISNEGWEIAEWHEALMQIGHEIGSSCGIKPLQYQLGNTRLKGNLLRFWIRGVEL